MIYGQPERFAVEWELDEDHYGTWMLGRIRYWVNGIQLGDWTPKTCLRDALGSLIYVVGDSGKRQHDELHRLPPTEAFDRLDKVFDTEDVNAKNFLGEEYARFRIELPPDEGFHGWQLYMTESGADARLLLGSWANDGRGSRFIKAQHLNKGEFDAIVARLQIELEEVWQRESDREKASEQS
jgi:hypothetical protein